MKKLILTFGLIIGTTLAFADSNVKEEAFDKTCVEVTLSCGVTGWACGYTPMEVLFVALAADAELCP